ncbi:MAG: recombination protein RecR [Bacteroidales bacterium]|nr:recombination protein RecR [Bacteroidales bacterium]MBP3344448.1 recombination protein RecR [Bacteroidales bacterium]MBQ8035063.1 recombination protein RecR [Bacteroidales bacterium]MBR4093894.1 recombination protein RecR [Bacteroidales bacterium]
MFRQNYSSVLLEKAVDEFSSLPGIGRKSALRLALHLLKQPQENVERFGNSFIALRKGVKYCNVCNMISDENICSVCSDSSRDRSIICVVESIRDVLSIENTGQYRGLYHVLGGIISPMDGVGPGDLPIKELTERVVSGEVKEVILALSTSMEGETTSFYLYKKLSGTGVQITTIARGVGFGDDLEYTDELTLGKSIENRHLFKF